MLLFALLACSDAPSAVVGDPTGLPLELDAGTYSVRGGSPTGPVVAVVVVTSTGTNAFTEDWYLSPSGASGTYAPFVRPGPTNPTITNSYLYVSSATTNPPTNPAPATGAIRWRHGVTKPQ